MPMVEALEVSVCLLQDRETGNQQRVRAGGGGEVVAPAGKR